MALLATRLSSWAVHAGEVARYRLETALDSCAGAVCDPFAAVEWTGGVRDLADGP